MRKMIMIKDNYKGIWIFAEQHDGLLEETVRELLSKAQELKAACGETVTAVLLGYEIDGLADELFAYGADEVLVCSQKSLATYKARPYQQALTAMVRQYRPSILLYGATSCGCNLAPRMMVSLETGLTADAIDLGFDENGAFYQTTPGYGGKILARIMIPEKRPQMATVRSGVFPSAVPDRQRRGKIVRVELDIEDDPCYEVLSTEKKASVEKPIEKSPVIVSGGRGIRTAEDLDLLREFAGLINAQVAGSRPLIDSGLLPHSLQIGQSGKTIKPELIINIAVSGSVQYRVGMEKSGTIVSINKSPGAPVFGISNYGVVGDFRAVLPAVIAEIRKRKA